MGVIHNHRWAELERWSPWLFVWAALFLLIGATNSGLAFFVEGFTFSKPAGLILELGRLAALLGTAGLTVGLMTRNDRLGLLTRVIASLAVLFVALLIALVLLTVAGVVADPSIVGLPAYVLSVSAFLVAGIVIIWTGAYATLIGGLLLVNVAALLVVFFGRLFVPLNLVATIGPGLQVGLYLSIGYILRERVVASQQPAPVTNPTP